MNYALAGRILPDHMKEMVEMQNKKSTQRGTNNSRSIATLTAQLTAFKCISQSY